MGIGDRSGEAAGYLHLGIIYIRCGEYDKADIKKKSSLVLQDNHRSCCPFALKDPELTIELTIVPDSCFYQVPLAALADGGDRFVSETFRI